MKTYEEFRREVLADIKRAEEMSLKPKEYSYAQIETMAANEYAKEMVLEYARWYEQNSAPPENQNDDWMIRQNVDSFFAGI